MPSTHFSCNSRVAVWPMATALALRRWHNSTCFQFSSQAVKQANYLIRYSICEPAPAITLSGHPVRATSTHCSADTCPMYLKCTVASRSQMMLADNACRFHCLCLKLPSLCEDILAGALSLQQILQAATHLWATWLQGGALSLKASMDI